LKPAVIVVLFLLSGCAAVPYVASAGGAALTQRQFFSVEDEIHALKQRIRILEDRERGGRSLEEIFIKDRGAPRR
jgi:hypothetical protein